MATTATYYGEGLRSLVEGRVDYLSATVKAMLTTSAYVPDPTDKYAITVNGEVTGTGYTAGGVALTGKVADYDAGRGTLQLRADPPSWTGNFTARRIVFYIDTGDVATSPLLLQAEFDADQVVVDEAFSYFIPAAGLVEISR